MSNKLSSSLENAAALRSRITDRIQSIEPLRRKALQYAAMALALVTIYSVYLKAVWSIPACRVVVIDFAYALVLLKFVALTGWPFALLAFLDDTWSSNDAGRVFLATFITTNWFWMHRYHHNFCPLSFAFEIFPYVFSALVGHAIGARTNGPRITTEEYGL